MRRSTLLSSLVGFVASVGVAVTSAQAQQFEFAAPPHTNANRVYSIDRTTGLVGACEFTPKAGTNGLTHCYPPGEGAGAQAPGDYHLVPSHMASELGLFRVNAKTGEMSVCYVNGDKVVCTAPTH